MMKFSKEKIESFIGWIGVLIVMINIFFPVGGIIAGVLFISKNYISLIFILLGIIIAAYLMTAFEYLRKTLENH